MWPHRWLLAFLLISCLHGLGSDRQQHPELTPAQFGTLHFPVASKSWVEDEFEHGVAWLHSFWYAEAEKQFLKISSDDPGTAVPPDEFLSPGPKYSFSPPFR